MMAFRVAKTAIAALLADAAAGRYTVVGHQRQSRSADADNKLVQVYYSEGAFPKTGRFKGEKRHDITIDIDIMVSARAAADIETLTSETATAQQRAQALASVHGAAAAADAQVDELIDIIYQILMDARNDELAQTDIRISSRWIDRVQKDTTLEHGGLVVKTGNLKYTCTVIESVPGDIGTEPATVAMDSDVPAGDSDGAGVTVINDNTEV